MSDHTISIIARMKARTIKAETEVDTNIRPHANYAEILFRSMRCFAGLSQYWKRVPFSIGAPASETCLGKTLNHSEE
ncbi:hypothetical protein [Celeribacter litoreus]|uniref:hypothetical protein n=1 Tax=Celeribacter litoreus TaxID=2876714 RepID=UPI001CCB58DF|nr:hypothetical protein [Celeribacter litoreus]